MVSGIYKIVHKESGKFYLGSSKNIKGRMRTHVKQLEGNRHHCQHLQAAWNKYGCKSFKPEIVEEIHTDDLLAVEQEYLDNKVRN